MKTVATYPAFDVVDLETPVIHLSAELCNDRATTGVRFCTAYESRRHGTLYREVSPNCIDYYCADIYPTAEEMAAQIANAKGLKYLVARNAKSGKFDRVTPAMLEAWEKDPDAMPAMIEVWDKDPSIQAFTDLMNRALDKPAEQVKVTGADDGPIEHVFRWQR